MFQAVNENNSQEQSATGKPFSSTRDPSSLNPAPTIVRNSHQAPTHPPAQHTAPYRLTGTPYEAYTMLCVEKVGTQDSREDEVETTMFNQRKRGEEMKNCIQQTIKKRLH
jgi:hypothetical protein